MSNDNKPRQTFLPFVVEPTEQPTCYATPQERPPILMIQEEYGAVLDAVLPVDDAATSTSQGGIHPSSSAPAGKGGEGILIDAKPIKLPNTTADDLDIDQDDGDWIMNERFFDDDEDDSAPFEYEDGDAQ